MLQGHGVSRVLERGNLTQRGLHHRLLSLQPLWASFVALVRQVFRWPPLALVVQVVTGFYHHLCPLYAASLAYYTLLSTVPILVLMLSVSSLLVNRSEIQGAALDSLTLLLPAAAEAMRSNVESLLRYRAPLGIISGVWTLWSSAAMFSVLERAINAVWGRPSPRNFWKQRLLGMISILGLTLWVFFNFLLRTLWRLLPHWFPYLNHVPLPPSGWLEKGFSFATISLLTVFVYRFFPARPVRWRIAVGTGLGVGLLWELTREFFTWALAAGWLRYPIVYGSLWVLVVPIVWAYWSYSLLLFGAEVLALLESCYPGRNIIRSRISSSTDTDPSQASALGEGEKGLGRDLAHLPKTTRKSFFFSPLRAEGTDKTWDEAPLGRGDDLGDQDGPSPEPLD